MVRYVHPGEELATQIKRGVRAADVANTATGTEKARTRDSTIIGLLDEFAVTSSPTVEPVAGWSPVAPPWVAGEYVWKRTTTTYGDGATAVGPALLATGNDGLPGADGATGAQGTSVVSTTYFYWLGATQPPAPTALTPPSPWTPVQPSYTPGSSANLYVVVRTIFSTGSSAYGVVSLDAAYDASRAAYAAAVAAQGTADAAAGLAAGKGRVWAQDMAPPAGRSYAWLGTENASPSVELLDGVEVRRNYNVLARRPEIWSKAAGVTLTPVSDVRFESAPVEKTGTGWVTVGTTPAVAGDVWTVSLRHTLPAGETFNPLTPYVGFGGGTVPAGTLVSRGIVDNLDGTYTSWNTRACTGPGVVNADLGFAPVSGVYVLGDPMYEKSPTLNPYFDGSTPSDRTYDLWIDTTDGDNTPNRWVNGAWAVVTDKVAKDAKLAADAAITSVIDEYATTSTPTTAPTTGWSTVTPVWTDTNYVWIRTTTTYGDGSIVVGTPVVVTGNPGRSVTDVDVMYYLSTSATALAGGSWVTTAPAWVDGRYMWTKTVTTYSQGAPTETDPVNITGAKGTTGSAGKGVTSIVEEYYLSTSSTTQTGGTWGTSVPTWIDGRFYWTRSKITYTDSSVVTTTPVMVSGGKGSTGNTGTSITSSTMFYHLSATQPSAPTTLDPPSPWTTTEPTYTPGSTSNLYFVIRTVLSTGAFSYSLVSMSASFAAAKSAFGKYTFSAAAPVVGDGAGKPVGAMWVRKSGAGEIDGYWEWSGSAWQARPLSQEIIPLIVAGMISAGAIDGMTITGALMRTAASGARVQLDSNGLRTFNSSGQATATLNTSLDGLSIGLTKGGAFQAIGNGDNATARVLWNSDPGRAASLYASSISAGLTLQTQMKRLDVDLVSGAHTRINSADTLIVSSGAGGTREANILLYSVDSSQIAFAADEVKFPGDAEGSFAPSAGWTIHAGHDHKLRRVKDICYLQVTLAVGTGAALENIGTVPPEFRPTVSVQAGVAVGQGGRIGTIMVAPTGKVEMVYFTAAGTGTYLPIGVQWQL